MYGCDGVGGRGGGGGDMMVTYSKDRPEPEEVGQDHVHIQNTDSAPKFPFDFVWRKRLLL